ncbi:MAG TPA: hypothetical protein VHE61_23625 [Opitutaceae bacterium]|nr:hypothetical protein [Opitutaceae bacterium]
MATPENLNPGRSADAPASAGAGAGRSPFGVGWFFVYGYGHVPAATYLPALRSLGATSTKVYLFWQQIEPEKGRFDWSAVDAFAGQLASPDEGLIALFSSSTWATTVSSTMLPPSPAKNLDDYYRFVFETVKRCGGRVRYWQNDAEPNNPVFWAGSKEQFVAQLRVFHRAVKDADPGAVVIPGGYDGMFVPPELPLPPGTPRPPPFPQQEHGLQFFDHVLKEAAETFDVFDLRLYGDPYTITARVEHMRSRMRAAGVERPIVCTEYGGPNFFEFPENRRYRPMVAAWSATVAGNHGTAPAGDNAVAELYAGIATLPPQTQMFMQGCSPELEAKLQRIQSRSLVMRNLFALSAGVERLLYWELLAVTGPRDDLMTLMFGKVGLLGFESGEPTKRTATADAFARMTERLAGVRSVTRVTIESRPTVYLFRVDRRDTEPMWVVWERRDAFSGEDQPPVEITWPAMIEMPQAIDALGAEIPVAADNGRIRVEVGVTPVYIEPTRRSERAWVTGI